MKSVRLKLFKLFIVNFLMLIFFFLNTNIKKFYLSVGILKS